MRPAAPDQRRYEKLHELGRERVEPREQEPDLPKVADSVCVVSVQVLSLRGVGTWFPPVRRG